MPSRGIFHPEKGVSIFVDKIDFKPKAKKAGAVFIVDRLRGQRVLPGGKLEYLVHWAGWPSKDDTWESSCGLPVSAPGDHEKANPSSIRHRKRKWKVATPVAPSPTTSSVPFEPGGGGGKAYEEFRVY